LSQFDRRSITRHVLISIAFVICYLLLTRPEAVVIYNLGTVAWYPVIAVVTGLLLGVSPWYAPLVAFSDALAGAVNYHKPLSTFSETAGAAGVAISYAVAAYLLRGPLRISFHLNRRRDVVCYIFVTFSAAAINAIIGTACLAADQSIRWHEYWPTASAWFLGDGIGLVGIAPFLLVHILPAVRRWLFQKPEPHDATQGQPAWIPGPYAALESLAQLVTLVMVVWLMFGLTWGRYHTFFLSFVPIIWIAMRQGMRRMVIGLVILNFAIVSGMDFAPPPIELIIKISLLMLVVSSVGLIVGSEVSERYRMAVHLNEQTTNLNALIENSPLGIVVFNREGRVELANPAFEKLLLYKQRDLAIGDIATLWLEGIATALPKAMAGDTCHETVRQKRKDGKTLDLALHAVPLIVKGSVRGVYAIYEDVSEQVRAVEAERKYAESQSRLVKELQLRTQQITLLNEMGSLLQGCGTVDEACAVVAQSVQKLFPHALSGALYLVQATARRLEAVTRWGTGSASEASFRVDFCAALREVAPQWSDLRDASIACHHLQQNSSARCLCVPILTQEATLGVLHLEFEGMEHLGSETARNNVQESEQSLAVTIAGQIAVSLASIRLREHLREQAIRDPLTGLFNRRFLEESLERELQRATRGRYTVSLLFLDLDHFKRFNDTFGHEAGDVVLRSLAVLLRSFFRSTDVCCRAGGEEFAIILPEAAPENAMVRANALRLEVKNLTLTQDDKPLGTVTVSIGIAAFPDHARTPEELLRIADRCLYDSKAGGRDRATLAKSKSFVRGA
jgi:diguanylate cyclase (GGDEF)-like protein/PAS domain S-box-containing protein